MEFTLQYIQVFSCPLNTRSIKFLEAYTNGISLKKLKEPKILYLSIQQNKFSFPLMWFLTDSRVLEVCQEK